MFRKSGILLLSGFVFIQNGAFFRDGKPYTFMGANFWPAVNLASTGVGGDRDRLKRELDRLGQVGVKNIRIMGSSQGPDTEPWRIVPSLESSPGTLDQKQWEGMDFLFSELRSRSMTAVVCLNNFWPWSGGMSQLLNWVGLGPIPYPPPEPGGSWSAYQNYVANYYESEDARGISERLIQKIVARYQSESAILAWELANEPRGAGHEGSFVGWIHSTARLIKSLDPNHLVTTGVEGQTPSPKNNGMDFRVDHSSTAIDYATIHIWAENWGWYDPARPSSLTGAIEKMREYFLWHQAAAKQIGKPLVLEEFGLGRDQGSYDPKVGTLARDQYFRAVFEMVESAMRKGESAGVNFWSWAGEAHPPRPGGHWKPGDPFLGDPPHEAQGWYSVYAEDSSTNAIIREFSLKFGQKLN